MGGFKTLRGLVLMHLLVFLLSCSNSSVCEARRGRQGNGSHHRGGGLSPHLEPKPSPSPNPSPSPTPSSPAGTFSVLDFGAKGNGVADDTEAFEAAWAAACQVVASTVLVPSNHEFLVGPVSFVGTLCVPNIVFQLDGTIIAPTSPKAWGSGLLQWLEFKKLNGINIQGSGIIEGQGSTWWSGSLLHHDHSMIPELSRKMPQKTPTAVRFYGSYNVTVTGITIRNSPQSHLKFDSCEAVDVSGVTISSPGDSPNTDGIHLQNSRGVSIHHSDLACGDDCVSIQTGCSDIHVYNVACGPGHGISIGGLGKDHTQACVSNVTVEDVSMNNTMTAVRIKTWQGGSGSVDKIKFSNINVTEVQIPIVIDQYYCDNSKCKNQSSAVALHDISYESIVGSFTVRPVYLACSESRPCVGISLSDIELEPIYQEHHHLYDPFCWEAYGKLHWPIAPPIHCLKKVEGRSNWIFDGNDFC